MATEVSAARARIMLSELLGRVAYARAEFVITRKGKPVARLVPIEEARPVPPSRVAGLADDDPFFAALSEIRSRAARLPSGRGKK